MPSGSYHDQCRVWGEYLQSHTWHFFITLTTGETPIAPARLLDLAMHWGGGVEHRYQVECRAFYVVEGSVYGATRPHVHVLLWGPYDAKVDDLQQMWRHGYAQVRRYDADLKGGFYVAKTLPHERAIFELPIVWPPLLASPDPRPELQVIDLPGTVAH